MNSSDDSRDSFLRALRGRIGGFRNERLGELAVERGWITADQLAACLERIERGSTHLDLPALLIEEGLLRPEQAVELGEKLKTRDAAKMVEPDPEPEVEGIRFGKFILVKELGRGGMGIVHRAWQTDLRRWVAVKRLRAEAAASLARFSREGRLAAQVVHPNLIPIHEVGEIDGTPYLSMALIDGGSIEGQRLPIRRALEILVDVAKAAQELHAAGICHRDIKPGNVMVDKTGRVFLGDFSLAWMDDGGAGLSKSGTMVGTPAYAPPEQILGARERLGPHSDVYAMGGTLHSLLTGEPPFEGRDSMEVARKALDEDPPSIRSIRPEVASPIQAICTKAMRKRPEDRFQSALEFAADLQRYLNGETVLARPPRLDERIASTLRRHRWIVAAVAVFGIGLGGYFAITSERQTARHLARLYSEARDQVDRVYRVNPASAAVQARTQATIDAYEAADPGSAKSHMLRMKYFMHADRHVESRAELAAALKADPQEPEAVYWDARIRHVDLLLKSWAILDAPGSWRRSDLLDPKTENELKKVGAEVKASLAKLRLAAHEQALMEGLGAGADRHWSVAAERLGTYLEFEPQDAFIVELRARTRFLDGKWDEAMADLNEAIRVAPRPNLYRVRAEAYHAHDEFKKAFDDLEHCDPKAPFFLCFKGSVLTELGRLDEAITVLGEAIKSYADKCTPLAMRANARRKRGELDLALQDCTTALDFDGPHYLPWRQRAFVYSALKRPDLALLDFEKTAAYEDGRERSETRSLIASCHHDAALLTRDPAKGAGHLEEAIRQAERAIADGSPFPMVYFVRGSATWQLRHDGAARADLERYLREAPNGPYAARARQLLREIEAK